MHANEKLLRATVEARRTGDLETARALMHPEILTHFPGRSPLAGDYRGPGALNAKVVELTGNPLEIELHEVLTSDSGAAVVYTMGATRGDSSVSWRQINHYTIRDGRIVEAWQNPYEQDLVDDFFA